MTIHIFNENLSKQNASLDGCNILVEMGTLQRPRYSTQHNEQGTRRTKKPFPRSKF